MEFEIAHVTHAFHGPPQVGQTLALFSSRAGESSDWHSESIGVVKAYTRSFIVYSAKARDCSSIAFLLITLIEAPRGDIKDSPDSFPRVYRYLYLLKGGPMVFNADRGKRARQRLSSFLASSSGRCASFFASAMSSVRCAC
jgi:hypothetical protein